MKLRRQRRARPEVPYPPVFRDWREPDRRVATARAAGGVQVETTTENDPPGLWRAVEITEEDACLLAASLLRRAERDDLAEQVLDGMTREPTDHGDTP